MEKMAGLAYNSATGDPAFLFFISQSILLKDHFMGTANTYRTLPKTSLAL